MLAKRRPSIRRWSWEKTLSEPALINSMTSEGYRTTRWSNDPRYKYVQHEHDFDKVILVIRGSITFRIPKIEEDYVLHAGDRLDLPAGYALEAEVGPQGVTCLEGQAMEEQDRT